MLSRTHTTVGTAALILLTLTGCQAAASDLTAQASLLTRPAADSPSNRSATDGPTQSAAPTPSASSQSTPTETTASRVDRTAPYKDSREVNVAASRARLNKLAVKGRAPKTGYDRSSSKRGYGAVWKDVDRNGCDTRNDMLTRDLDDERYKPGTRNCVVETGLLRYDPYSGKTIRFQRGQKTSSAIQIEHVVALSDSWQKGAQQWTQAKREQFANDPLNLLAVDGPTNSSKGDKDAASWQPPNKPYRCGYVASQIDIKFVYGLWVTAAEKDALARMLNTCPK